MNMKRLGFVLLTLVASLGIAQSTYTMEQNQPKQEQPEVFQFYPLMYLKNNRQLGWLYLPQFNDSVLINIAQNTEPAFYKHKKQANFFYANPDMPENYNPNGLYYWYSQYKVMQDKGYAPIMSNPHQQRWNTPVRNKPQTGDVRYYDKYQQYVHEPTNTVWDAKQHEVHECLKQKSHWLNNPFNNQQQPKQKTPQTKEWGKPKDSRNKSMWQAALHEGKKIAINTGQAAVNWAYTCEYRVNDTKITLFPGKLTKQNTEAIVNPTNTTLIPNSTDNLDTEIHAAAHKKINELGCYSPTYRGCKAQSGCYLCTLCRSYYPNGCQLTQASITDAGKLNEQGVKNIIHIVGPAGVFTHAPNKAPGYSVTEQAKQQLAWAYYNCLKLAQQNGLKSIAFPQISVAQNFPINVATDIILITIEEFVQNNPDAFTEIRLVMENDELGNNGYEAYKTWLNNSIYIITEKEYQEELQAKEEALKRASEETTNDSEQDEEEVTQTSQGWLTSLAHGASSATSSTWNYAMGTDLEHTRYHDPKEGDSESEEEETTQTSQGWFTSLAQGVSNTASSTWDYAMGTDSSQTNIPPQGPAPSLHYAAYTGNLNMARYLAKQPDFDPYVKNIDGYTAYEVASTEEIKDFLFNQMEAHLMGADLEHTRYHDPKEGDSESDEEEATQTSQGWLTSLAHGASSAASSTWNYAMGTDLEHTRYHDPKEGDSESEEEETTQTS